MFALKDTAVSMYKAAIQRMFTNFSNSLIVDKENTKEINV